MKNIVKLAIVTLCISSFFSSIAYADNIASCHVDVHQMVQQIKQHGSITTQDGRYVNQVLSPRSGTNNQCTADAFEFGYFVCVLKWETGNWGNTIYCS